MGLDAGRSQVRDPRSVLFVSDLDSTLLRSDASLGPRTVEILGELLGRGMRFTYATARSHLSAARILGVLPLELPVITYGGTVLADPSTGAPQDIRYLPPGALERILRATDASELVEPVIHTYSRAGDRLRWRPEAETPGVRFFLDSRPGDPRLLPLDTWAEMDPASAFYVSIVGEREAVSGLRDALSGALSADCELLLSADVYEPGMHWLEIHAADGSKAHGVERLKERFGFDYVVAFGDNVNDIPMFRQADEAYAVANAIQELREIATGVIGRNDEDGVAHWLAMRFRIGLTD